MTRIFSSLALLAVLMLATNLVIGLTIGDFNERAVELREAQRAADRLQLLGPPTDDPDWQAARDKVEVLSRQIAPLRQRTSFHQLCGIAAALVTMLVNSVAVTYFVGTSRWCLEVSQAYHLDLQRVEQCRRLKSRTFASALVSMLTMIVLAGLGAAADPGNSRSGGADWSLLHLLMALVGTVVVVGCFWDQVGKVRANYVLIQAIMNDVRQIRDEHGLESPRVA